MTSEIEKKNRLESKALRISIFGYLAMAVLGILFSLLTGSGAILIDGVYSLVSFAMAILASRVAGLVDRPGDNTFHFGYPHFEPLLNLIRGLIILAIAAFALFTAISALFSGGRPLSPGLALGYSVCVGALCVAMSIYQRHNAKKTDSPSLAVDARNWLVDGVITLAVGVGFLIGLVLSASPWSYLLPYVDPATVVLLSLTLFPLPLRTVVENAKQVLVFAPEPSVQEEVHGLVDKGLEGITYKKRHVRMAVMGRFGYLLIHVVLPEDFQVKSAGDLDRIRQRIAAALVDLHPRLVLDIVFTAKEHWIHGSGE